MTNSPWFIVYDEAAKSYLRDFDTDDAGELVFEWTSMSHKAYRMGPNEAKRWINRIIANNAAARLVPVK